MATRNDFKAFQRQARQLLKGLPKMMGKMALIETSDNWRRQGYENEAGAVVPWAPRKARPGRTAGRAIRRRAILVQSGRLRRSPRIVSSTASSVTIGTDVPYGKPLQQGTAHMPARPFFTMGKGLSEKIIRKTAADITKLLG